MNRLLNQAMKHSILENSRLWKDIKTNKQTKKTLYLRSTLPILTSRGKWRIGTCSKIHIRHHADGWFLSKTSQVFLWIMLLWHVPWILIICIIRKPLQRLIFKVNNLCLTFFWCVWVNFIETKLLFGNLKEVRNSKGVRCRL